ncbi:hypothetical protein ACFLZY_02980 [Patescibacteria group bacterium]
MGPIRITTHLICTIMIVTLLIGMGQLFKWSVDPFYYLVVLFAIMGISVVADMFNQQKKRRRYYWRS